jgi:hypothetical protein
VTGRRIGGSILGGADLALQIGDARLDEALPLTRRVVFRPSLRSPARASAMARTMLGRSFLSRSTLPQALVARARHQVR